jgi:ribokinase
VPRGDDRRGGRQEETTVNGERSCVVVAGSLHYDVMVEAPDRPRKGETVAGHRWYPKFGGKGGNQAVAARRAGAPVRFVGAVGDDDFGRFLTARLEAEGVDASRVAVVPGVGSGMSVAIQDGEGDYGAVIVTGANAAVDPAAFFDGTLWRDARLLLLQNEVPVAIDLAAARAARGHGARVCLNAAPFRPFTPGLEALVDILVVNAVEAEQACGVVVRDLASAAVAAERLVDRFPAAVVTAGGDGVAAAARGGETVSLAAPPVDVVSTHGAGDVFVGVLAAALAAGSTFADALSRANAAAAAHVAGG